MRLHWMLGFLLVWPGATHAAELRVVATLSDLASIAESLGGDRIEVDYLVDGRFDTHAVEILPSSMLKVSRADLFLQVGLDLEIWAPQVIAGARNRDLRVVDCSAGIEVLDRPTGGVDAGMGDIHVGGNPHYWLDPENGLIVARTLADAFAEADPEGAELYEHGYAEFSQALLRRLTDWESRMAPYVGTEVVYFHDSWPYFNRAFGLQSAGFVEPKPGVSPSPAHTARLVATIRSRGIPLIVMAPHFDRRVPDSIARQTGAAVVVLATSVGGIEGADDYLSLFDANLRRLEAALGNRE